MSLLVKRLTDVNVARSARWHPGGMNEWSPERWLVATVGELGEAAAKIEAGGPEFLEELADTFIYLNLFTVRMGMTLTSELCTMNDLVMMAGALRNRTFHFTRATKHLGEAANALKKWFRIENGMANISEPDRQLSDISQVRSAIRHHCFEAALALVETAELAGGHNALEKAVIGKFNATSERYGFPERLP